MLSRSQIDHFVERGHVRVEEAIPRSTADACRSLAAAQLQLSDVGPWEKPVYHAVVDGPPVYKAANSRRLMTAVEQLLEGEGWLPRPNLGLWVVRCPSEIDSQDTGWHIDASFEGPNTDSLTNWYVNFRSKGRGLLLLCLLSDVGVDDSPTRIADGSHTAVPERLVEFGDDGVQGLSFDEPSGPISLATGGAGDVFLCHPFLVHAAQWPHRGSSPRFLTQPPIGLDTALRVDRPVRDLSIVARMVHDSLPPGVRAGRLGG